MRTQRSRSRLLFLALLALAACGGPRRYVHPGLDPATMKRVAVLPFENLSTDRVVGEKALRLLVLELLASGVYEVVEFVAGGLAATNAAVRGAVVEPRTA